MKQPSIHLRIFHRTSLWTAGIALAAATALVACGGGGGGGGETGTLRLAMTDAPACGWEHVWVTVERVRVHTRAGANDNDAGWRELVLDPPRRIDLTTLTNGVLEELGTLPLPAGRYSQVRLVLSENGPGSGPQALRNAVQPVGESVQPLVTPSALQSGLKLQAHFDVEANQLADLVLDFDACQSVVPRGASGQYNLKPVVSVFKRLVGSIEGYVSTTMPLAQTQVSAQVNGRQTRATVPDSTGRFYIPFLPYNTYNIVVTAEGRSTAVVSGVPVTTGIPSTVVNGTATAIVSPASAIRNVDGSVTATGGTPLVTATVSAVQALTAGETIEVARTPVHATSAAYTLRLPVAAPVRATWAAGLLGPFQPDAAVAGRYVFRAEVPNRVPEQVSVDVNLATVTPPVGITFP